MFATKDEIIRLVEKRGAYAEIKEDTKHYRIQNQRSRAYVLICASIVVCTAIIGLGLNNRSTITGRLTKSLKGSSPKCLFCSQNPPKLHHDQSYTINNVNNGAPAVVIPMTITYEYDLYDGQNIFTMKETESIPNLDFDYVIVEMSEARNINRDTNKLVSLDEIYLHHLTTSIGIGLGAEMLAARTKDTPLLKYSKGYAKHILAKDNPNIKMNAHLISNKNLAPIEGSTSRARKECNECWYSPGKGSDCTPEVSGTFACCGDSFACTVGEEECACATTNIEVDKSKTTKYRIEIDLLISRDINKFKRVDNWLFMAPTCSVNLNGKSVFTEVTPDNACFGQNDGLAALYSGGGSTFHSVPENNSNPYLKTKINVVAPTGGKIVSAQAHLHTGGINATLFLNGVAQCTATTVYGTNSDVATNAQNEQNHLIKIGSCYDEVGEAGISFEEGDVFTTESFYYGGTDDTRMDEIGAAGEHKNVMSYFNLGVDFDGDTKFVTEERSSVGFVNNFALVADYDYKKN